MPNTFRAALYSPYGVLKCVVNSAGTTTTFHTTNADAADINIGDKVKIYSLFIFTHTLRTGLVTITNKQIDTPVAGTTRFTFSPAVGSATQNNDQVYDPEIVNVTTWISNNMDILDKMMGAFPCTSSTRPTGSSRFSDMLIFERDTQELRRWDAGSALWELISHPRRARGRIGYTSNAAAGPDTAQNVQTGPYMSITFTQNVDQWYQLFTSCNLSYVSGANDEGRLCFRIADGGAVTGSSPLVGSKLPFDPMTNNDSINVRGTASFKATATKQVTVGVFLDRTGMVDTGVIRFTPSSHNMFCVEDMGQ